MRRIVLALASFLFLFINPIYSQEEEGRNYSCLYLYPMDLSEEVLSSIDEFLRSYKKKYSSMHYMEISILDEQNNPAEVYYMIKLINSPDKEKLVINEEHLGFGWYKDIEPVYRYVGYSYYKKHWIIVSKWYKLQDIHNPFIKKSSYSFVKDFLLWKHEVHPPPGVANPGIRFIVRENDVYKCPPLIEE